MINTQDMDQMQKLLNWVVGAVELNPVRSPLFPSSLLTLSASL